MCTHADAQTHRYAWTDRFQAQTDVCRRTPTCLTHIRMNTHTHTCIKIQMWVDKREFTLTSGVWLCKEICKGVFNWWRPSSGTERERCSTNRRYWACANQWTQLGEDGQEVLCLLDEIFCLHCTIIPLFLFCLVKKMFFILIASSLPKRMQLGWS